MDQPEVAFLDEVEEVQPAPQVALGDLHHQAQVALDHALARDAVALARKARVVLLLFRGEQRREPDLAQIATCGV
jgi:hypothetical protein